MREQVENEKNRLTRDREYLSGQKEGLAGLVSSKMSDPHSKTQGRDKTSTAVAR